MSDKKCTCSEFDGAAGCDICSDKPNPICCDKRELPEDLKKYHDMIEGESLYRYGQVSHCISESEFDFITEEVKNLVFNNIKARVFGVIEQYRHTFWKDEDEREKKVELMKKTLMPEIIVTSRKIEKYFDCKRKELFNRNK